MWAKPVLLLGKGKGQQWINKNGNYTVLINKSEQMWKGGALDGEF